MQAPVSRRGFRFTDFQPESFSPKPRRLGKLPVIQSFPSQIHITITMFKFDGLPVKLYN
jgi:hypothetical protein